MIRKALKQPLTLMLHIALAVILAGALVTHYGGIQGRVQLTEGASPVTMFEKTSGPGDGQFPFGVSLREIEVRMYPGTTTPMDYISRLRVGDRDVSVSMNHVAEVEGWRFSQSGLGQSQSTLSISYDPVGTGITYTGYILFGISMVGFLFQRGSRWRGAIMGIKRGALMKALPIVCLILPTFAKGEAIRGEINGIGPEVQRPLAKNLGKVYVYWNDRVCPLQTMAYDVTMSLYGSTTYKGQTAEQVLAGWLFHYDAWLRDYRSISHPARNEKERKKEEEREALIQWLGTGGAFRIYPYKSASGNLEWLSLSERRPSKMDIEQWKFMVSSMRGINEDIQRGHNIEANEKIGELLAEQKKYAGEDVLPSGGRMRAECFYNRYVRLFPLAGLMLLCGLILLVKGIGITKEKGPGERWVKLTAGAGSVIFTGLLGFIIGLRWYIGGHIPLTNGPETMLFMGIAACIMSVWVGVPAVRGAMLMTGGLAVLVAAMSSRTPQIGSMMPVLSSPLLSIHVMLVMCSYVLFVLMAILGGAGLYKGGEVEVNLANLNRVILIPAVFLLGAGIFVGAYWANQSWGRYWGWDPKETCALITMLIYAVPIHSKSLRVFRRARVLNLYLLIGVISVIFTYFGANYLLPGLHSYA